MKLFNSATKDVTLGNIELDTATWSQEDVDRLEFLIEQAHTELNLKFSLQTRDITGIPTIDLTKIKKNKQIYKAFVAKRDEHIRYFKEFPKYVKGRTEKHLKIIEEHLEKSKETLTFDAKKLADELDFVQGMCRRHANFIARDQLGKFSSAINEAQAEYVGATEYIWRTSLDNRVRPEHAAREGKKFKYDQPPIGGNPGMDYRCRCVAEAILHL